MIQLVAKALAEILVSPLKENKEIPQVTYALTHKNVEIVQRCPLLQSYKSVWWAVGPFSQTLLQRLYPISKKDSTCYRRELFKLSFDNVELALDWKEDGMMDSTTPVIMCLHGLGGDSGSKYMQVFTNECMERGVRLIVYNRRGHADSNLMPEDRGKHVPHVFPQHVNMEDMEEVVAHVHTLYPRAPKYLVGFSCGANLAIHYIVKHPEMFKATVSICNGYDIWKLNELLLAHHPATNKLAARFLQDVLKRNLTQAKIIAKAQELDIDFDKAMSCKTLNDFESAVVFPAYGYTSLEEYYTAASCCKHLDNVTTPLLCINNQEDPIVPAELIDIPRIASTTNPNIINVETVHGGHLGWIDAYGKTPWYMKLVFEYFAASNVTKNQRLVR